MIRIYCRHHEHNKELCPQCRELLQYAQARLNNCPFGDRKHACKQCAIHCYKPTMRQRIQEVMRFAGPRMPLYAPLMALRHLLDQSPKRIITIMLLIFMGYGMAHAQEAGTTSPTSAPESRLPDGEPWMLPGEVKDMGGFLLDMSILKLNTAPKLSLNWELPDPTARDYAAIFALDPRITYGKANGTSWSTQSGWLNALYGNANAPTLQMGSFQLKNGWRLNTYGQYDADGWRVPNPSALPWQRNDFHGAFELKSANGAFGIKIEVEKKRGW